MPSAPPSMPTLLELQRGFLGALLGEPAAAATLVAGDPEAAPSLIGVYANNAAVNFLESLRLTYPALLRLTGDEYFAQAAHAYRRRHPSRSGDLQWVGANFAEFLAERHGEDGYRYLADVARFEWLVQESLLAADHAPFDLRRLAAVAPDAYDELRFILHPAVRLFVSPFPAYTIWDANRDPATEPPLIDLGQGPERVLIARQRGRSAYLPLTAGEYAFLDAIATGKNFAAALAATAAEPDFAAPEALQKFVLCESIIDFST